MKYPNIYIKSQLFTHTAYIREHRKITRDITLKLVFCKFSMINVLESILFNVYGSSFNPVHGSSYFPLGSVTDIIIEPI